MPLPAQPRSAKVRSSPRRAGGSAVERLPPALLWPLVMLLAATSGCTRRRAPAPPLSGVPTAPGASSARATDAPAFVPCTRPAPLATGSSPPIVLAGIELIARRAGQLEARTTRDPLGRQAGRPERLLLGVLSDPREALPQTLAQLARLQARFRAAQVDAVVVLGGLDGAFVGAVRLLRALRGPWALLALAGDRLSAEGFQAALRHAEPGAIDLTRTQIVALPQLTLVGIPGYPLPHHHLAGAQGCGFDAGELALLGERLRGSTTPRLVLAHAPPRGRGPAAVDRARGEVNIGDSALRDWIERNGVRFGVFGHVHEAAGQATRLDGTPVAPERWTDSLLLQVGSIDAVPHQQRDGRWSKGTAALLELEGERARYTMITFGDEAALAGAF